jgi:UDP-N-acetylglucosamine--N-acetylmuramyl-(pentapeptide) pyrophosphoryl-undecaprenol N-acetylglucosamine transferase
MRVILAGGGTGGHIFPALAIAQEFIERGDKDTVLFVGSKKGLDKMIISKYGYPLKVMDLEGFKGKGLGKKVLSLSKFAKGLFSAFKILRDFRPDLVVGVGGYSSAPIVMVASLLRVKTVVLEQNLLPGLTNRLLSNFACIVFTSFEESYSYFPKTKTHFTGNPVRSEILSLYREMQGPESSRESLSKDKEKFNLFILGGSQGSHQINLVMIKVLDYLSDIRERIEIVHQSGKDDIDLLRSAYHEKGFSGKVMDFIDNIGDVYDKSDLVICRGGATTISELLISGKASIIIPYPYAADNHQELNAKALERKGAAVVMGVGGLREKELAITIKDFFKNPEKIKNMENKVLEMARPDATKIIVDRCYNLIGKNVMKKEKLPDGVGNTK